jgi:hypothetical protein
MEHGACQRQVRGSRRVPKELVSGPVDRLYENRLDVGRWEVRMLAIGGAERIE